MREPSVLIGMMHPIRAIVTVIGFAAVTATSGLALLAPHVTHADGEDRKGAFLPNLVTASASFEKDDTAKGGWKIVIAAENPTDTNGTDDFDIAIDFSMSNPNSRTGGPQTAVWRHKEKIVLAAHETKSITIDCPSGIAKQLAIGERLQEKREALMQKWNEKGGDIPQWVYATYNAPRANYWVEATQKPVLLPKEPAPKQGQALAKAKVKA